MIWIFKIPQYRCHLNNVRNATLLERGLFSLLHFGEDRAVCVTKRESSETEALVECDERSHPQYPHWPPQISTVRCISSRSSHTQQFSVDMTDSRQLQGSRLLKFTFHNLRPLIRLHFSNSVIEVLILAWIGLKWRKDEVHSVCWGGCDQSLELIKARSSLRSKRSVITPLWIHSGFYIPAHGETALCSLHLNVIRDYRGEINM